MSERISLDDIEPQQFDSLVDLLAEWLAQGEVKVRFRMPAQVELDFVEEKVSQQLKSAGLPSACIGQLRLDVPFMLSGILTGYRNAVMRMLADHAKVSAKGTKPTRDQITKELTARAQRVEEKLVSAELRRQYVVKRTAKASTYIDTSWEVVEKQQDSVRGSVPKQVYATLRVTAQKPSTRAGDVGFLPPFSFGLLNPPQYDELTLTMTTEDLQDIVDSLSKALNALKQASTAKAES
ncbi:MAG: hypothetical protein HYU86_00265 [Chloroflexi bacterium]|nr:hypothetical protein [Chloroflexota bacterium]